ncbi:MAG: hypothetical protein FWG68_10455 [Defluviitaleaceae bacterium]|nr:hypothetical protein [Defluviitaleaceae bacterium]
MDTLDQNAWLDIKHEQIAAYRKQANIQQTKAGGMIWAVIFCWLCAIALPIFLFVNLFNFAIVLAPLILIPVANLIWEFSRHEQRAAQLLYQLAQAIEDAIKNGEQAGLRKAVTQIETRFLSNDDELFVKKAIWGRFMQYKKRKRDAQLQYERELNIYMNNGEIGEKPEKQIILVDQIELGPVWNVDIPHRQGYKDSNTIGAEWTIMRTFRELFTADDIESYKILKTTSRLAQQNPVVFERYLRKKKISKKLKQFKRAAGVNYLSAAAKMKLVAFVESVLALEPTELNEETITLFHEKNEQIQKYTDEFWRVHKRSLKFYWFEALWLLLIIPFTIGAAGLIANDAIIEGILLFTIGAALVAYGEMALVVMQKIKLNGKKLIPPLIASLIGSRHAMCADTKCEEGIENYRRRFKNLEKHFIMTTSEIDSVKYVKDNLRDEERTSKIHEAEDLCEETQKRMDTYYKMFHLYRKRCLQYGCLELFWAIMLVPTWGVSLIGMALISPDLVSLFWPTVITLGLIVFEIIAITRHVQVWRFKEMYFKIYQGLSVLIVDGDLRQNPEKLDNMFKEIEQSALDAISQDSSMKLMVGTLSRVSGLAVGRGA